MEYIPRAWVYFHEHKLFQFSSQFETSVEIVLSWNSSWMHTLSEKEHSLQDCAPNASLTLFLRYGVKMSKGQRHMHDQLREQTWKKF